MLKRGQGKHLNSMKRGHINQDLKEVSQPDANLYAFTSDAADVFHYELRKNEDKVTYVIKEVTGG